MSATFVHAQSGELTMRPGRWIEGWVPEDQNQWIRQGRRIARRNLGFSVYGGFMVPQVFNQAIKLQSGQVAPVRLVEGYSLGLSWLVAAYVVCLVLTVALYVIPYARRGQRV